MLNPRNNCRGVTIAEVLVAVAVVAVLLALAAPNVRDAYENRQLRTAAESILAGLRAARGEALAQNQPVDLLVQGAGWRVCKVPDPPPAWDPAACNSVLHQRASAELPATARVNVSVVASLAATGGGAAALGGGLRFTPLGRVDPATLPAGQLAVFDVVPASAGRTCAAAGGTSHCLTVVASASGQFRICDRAVAPTDARACS